MNRPLIVLDADVLGRQRTGDESYVSALLVELAQHEGEFRFAAVTRHPELVPDGIEPVELRARSQPLRMAVTFPRLLRRLRPRITHFGHVIAPRSPRPAVVTIHDLSFERYPNLMGARDRFFFRTMVPWSVRRAARVLAVSERTKSDLVERYSLREDKIVVIPNGVDPVFTPEGPGMNGSPYVLFVGALHPRKDPVAAIEALALLGADFRLLLAGPDKGVGDEARRAVARLGLNGRVEFLGHVDKTELALLYRSAECLVFPSRYEGFGLPVVEAMASGTPVVATAVGAVSEVAGEAAILVEPGDPAALAEGIERALGDRPRLVRAGFKQSARFSWAETARRTLHVYRELI